MLTKDNVRQIRRQQIIWFVKMLFYNLNNKMINCKKVSNLRIDELQETTRVLETDSEEEIASE